MTLLHTCRTHTRVFGPKYSSLSADSPRSPAPNLHFSQRGSRCRANPEGGSGAVGDGDGVISHGHPTGIPRASQATGGTNWKPGLFSRRDPAAGPSRTSRSCTGPGHPGRKTYLGKKQSQGWKTTRAPTTSSLNPDKHVVFFFLLTHGRHQDLPRESLSILPPAKNKYLPCRKEMAVEEKAVGEGEASFHRGHTEPRAGGPGTAARPPPVREPGAMAKPSAQGDPPARWLRRA